MSADTVQRGEPMTVAAAEAKACCGPVHLGGTRIPEGGAMADARRFCISDDCVHWQRIKPRDEAAPLQGQCACPKEEN